LVGFSDILTIVVPVFVVIAVGYCTGRMHLFDGERAEALRDLTVQLALPAVLFISIVNTPRSVLLGQGPLVGLLALGLLGLYAILLLALRFGARLTIQRSALFALACVMPQFAFMGISILGGLFGAGHAAIPIAVAGILVNVFLAPAALVLMNLRSRNKATAEITPAAEPVVVGAAGEPAPPVAGGAPAVPITSGAATTEAPARPSHGCSAAARAVRLGPAARPAPGTRRRASVQDHLDLANPDRRSVLGRGAALRRHLRRPHRPPPAQPRGVGDSPDQRNRPAAAHLRRRTMDHLRHHRRPGGPDHGVPSLPRADEARLATRNQERPATRSVGVALSLVLSIITLPLIIQLVS
jgi:hypothetical protein